jgi:ankyrin repeat protein
MYKFIFPLIEACKTSDVDQITRLLEQGRDVNETDNNSGITPMYFAIQCCRLEIADILISYGSNMSYKNAITYVELAAKFCHPEMVKLLISRGFDFKIPDKPFHYLSLSTSANERFKDIVYILENWPVTMAIVTLQELSVYNQIDLSDICDMCEFI